MSLPDDAQPNWSLTRPEDVGTRAAKHRLVRETKRLIDAVALLDIEDVAADAVESLADGAARLVEQVNAHPSLAEHGGLAHLWGRPDGALHERSGISGRSNPLAPPMEIEIDGDVTRATATYTAAYEGPPNTVHGGFVAAAFDDLLGVAQQTSGQAGYTGTLTVKMRRPTPLFTRIDYEAGVRRVDGRKIICWGKSMADGELVAEAECLFVIPRARWEAGQRTVGEAPAR